MLIKCKGHMLIKHAIHQQALIIRQITHSNKTQSFVIRPNICGQQLSRASRNSLIITMVIGFYIITFCIKNIFGTHIYLFMKCIDNFKQIGKCNYIFIPEVTYIFTLSCMFTL